MDASYPPVDVLYVVDADLLEEPLRVFEKVEDEDVSFFVADAENRLATITSVVGQTRRSIFHVGQDVAGDERRHRRGEKVQTPAARCHHQRAALGHVHGVGDPVFLSNPHSISIFVSDDKFEEFQGISKN